MKKAKINACLVCKELVYGLSCFHDHDEAVFEENGVCNKCEDKNPGVSEKTTEIYVQFKELQRGPVKKRGRADAPSAATEAPTAFAQKAKRKKSTR